MLELSKYWKKKSQTETINPTPTYMTVKEGEGYENQVHFVSFLLITTNKALKEELKSELVMWTKQKVG